MYTHHPQVLVGVAVWLHHTSSEMDFSQWNFWFVLMVALPILLVGNFISHRSARFQKTFICLLSLFLLGLASLQTLAIFLLVTLVAYFACLIGVKSSKSTQVILLCVLVPVLFSPLLYYKYSYFIGHSILGREWNCLRDLMIPIGISFYSFQVVGFCVDTLLRGYKMPAFPDYLNFCAFFPQIVAGPIERRDDLLPQISAPSMTLCSRDVCAGVPYVLLGLFFKMALADNLAFCMKPGYAGGNALVIWANNLIFTFRIYFDFAGYGLTAFGIAKCLGITLRMNFLSPYTSTNISEFWRRWHTSLTLWFRDYIYFPLGGSRTRLWAVNILIVFLVSGLWHGAGWNFVVWGGFSGVGMVLHRIFRKKGYTFPSFVGWGMTFGMMVFVWMFFYISDWTLLSHHVSVILSPSAYNLKDYFHLLVEAKFAGAMTLPFIALSFMVILVELFSVRRNDNPYALFLHPYSLGIMVMLMILLVPGQDSPFIYFAF